ncbi:MAG: EndoU domain-containing protein [Magnetospirillum sp.]|nr:EndoU domain-containing protein [Magnetospirillum sp.]
MSTILSFPFFRPTGASLRTLLAAVLLSGLALGQPALAQVSCPQDNSDGPPVVNNQHIFCGEINGKGRATGFHSRPGGIDPEPVSGIGDPVPKGPAGIYNLYDFYITQDGATGKKAISTMFPDTCTKDNVLAAIRNARENGQVRGREFTGPSGDYCKAGKPPKPFEIKGFLDDDGDIVTAYPNY